MTLPSCLKADLRIFLRTFFSTSIDTHSLPLSYSLSTYLSFQSLSTSHISFHLLPLPCLSSFHHLPLFISHCMNNSFHNMEVIFSVARFLFPPFCKRILRLTSFCCSQNDITHVVISACTK